MAETQIPLDIGAKAIIKFQEYTCTGVLKIEKKKNVFSFKPVQKYFIISKGAKDNNWNLFCFSDQDATRAEWAHSMLQMESVRKYDKRDVVGFRIVFIDSEAKMSEIVLICDTEENREMWMSKLQEAIRETHSFSKDSGFESGGSMAGLQWGAFRNSKNCGRGFNNYDTIDDDFIAKTPDDEKQKKKVFSGGVENSEETILKLPTSVEATSDETPTQNDTEGAMALSLPQSTARSESFGSIEAASDLSLTALSTSSLYVSGGAADTSVDTSSSNDRNSSSSSESDTTTYDKPTCFSQVAEPEEYFCGDGQNPIELLEDTPIETFLIDRKKKGLILHVMTQAGVKCFKLFEQNGKVSLYKDFSISPNSVFSSLDNFLKHYSVHCIPKENYSVRLTKGYRKVIKESVEWK